MSSKKALVLVLVVLLVLIGVPVQMPGMGTAMCHDCGPMLSGSDACAAAVLVSALVLVAALFAVWTRSRRERWAPKLFAFLLERPPQLV